MAGAFAHAEREHFNRAWLASRTGWLAQSDPRKQPSLHALAGLSGGASETLSPEDGARALTAWARARGA